MAFAVIHGGDRGVTSARPDVSRFSRCAVNLQRELVKGGARIVGIAIGPDGVDIDWLPADADPELPPFRSSLLLPGTTGAVALLVIAEDDEEIPVELDAPAIAALETEASSLSVVSLAAWVARRDP